MSYSGEAADQVVRLSLNGVEVAAKLSGSAAKQLAIMIYAILKDQKKNKRQDPSDQYAPLRQGTESVRRQGW